MAAPRMVARGGKRGSIVVVRLAYGDLLLESLQEICRKEKIRNGVVLTGFGSLTDLAVTGVVGRLDPSTGQKLLESVRAYPRRNGGPDQEGSHVTVEKRLRRRRP